MTLTFVLAVTPPGKQPWFWAVADAIIGVLLFLNLLVFVGVYVRRFRERSRLRRRMQFEQSFERLMAEHGPDASGDVALARHELSRFNELQRPLAAAGVIDRFRDAPPEERARMLEWMRQVGGIAALLRSLRRWAPWRRTLAVRLLGHAGADEAVPALIDRLSDRSRYVREAAVRALGRIGDARALPALERIYHDPGRVSSGIAYEALLAFDSASAPVFAAGLNSPNAQVRVPSVFGFAAVRDATTARARLEPILGDDSASVRAAAAGVLGRIGGHQVVDELARATRDEERSVRRAAVSALASYDDPEAVRLVVSALDDPDRDTALRAGETLVRLSRLPHVGPSAAAAIAAAEDWPIERARVLASLGVV